MQSIKEVCIAHTKKDYAKAIYFRDFCKWIGISFFDFTYNEQNPSLNQNIFEGKNHFDLLIDINGTGEKINGLETIAEIYVKTTVRVEDIREAAKLKEVWGEVLGKSDLPMENMKSLFHLLIDEYSEHDIMRKILNNRHVVYMRADIEDKAASRKELLEELNEWKNTVAFLKGKRSDYSETPESGIQYLDYAIGYSCRKANEICRCLKMSGEYDTLELIQQLNYAYSYATDFYMLKCLRSKIAALDTEYEALVISDVKSCAEECTVDSCESFHLYRLGKEYEQIGKREYAVGIFTEAYSKCKLNFRALFKVAADKVRKMDYQAAEYCLCDLLAILQIYDKEKKLFSENEILNLPPLELEYAVKCYMMLGNTEKAMGNEYNADVYYRKVVDVSNEIECNSFINEIYQKEEAKHVIEFLRKRLSYQAITERLDSLK